MINAFILRLGVDRKQSSRQTTYEAPRVLPGEHSDGVLTISADGQDAIACDLAINSTKGVDIDLKCFKTQPPPPEFKPCPEAGQINLPKSLPQEGYTTFRLPAPKEAPVKTYFLAATDSPNFDTDKSSINLTIHVMR